MESTCYHVCKQKRIIIRMYMTLSWYCVITIYIYTHTHNLGTKRKSVHQQDQSLEQWLRLPSGKGGPCSFPSCSLHGGCKYRSMQLLKNLFNFVYSQQVPRLPRLPVPQCSLLTWQSYPVRLAKSSRNADISWRNWRIGIVTSFWHDDFV